MRIKLPFNMLRGLERNNELKSTLEYMWIILTNM